MILYLSLSRLNEALSMLLCSLASSLSLSSDKSIWLVESIIEIEKRWKVSFYMKLNLKIAIKNLKISINSFKLTLYILDILRAYTSIHGLCCLYKWMVMQSIWFTIIFVFINSWCESFILSAQCSVFFLIIITFSAI